ncbi:unnamed protein product [Amoebophrya sp. A25]|nr:unnamed protein product [Amoebophrya sp. A25]|eukprot:GSA25T00010431001.1
MKKEGNRDAQAHMRAICIKTRRVAPSSSLNPLSSYTTFRQEEEAQNENYEEEEEEEEEDHYNHDLFSSSYSVINFETHLVLPLVSSSFLSVQVDLTTFFL